MFAIASLAGAGCASRGGPALDTGFSRPSQTGLSWPLQPTGVVLSSPFGDMRGNHRHNGADLQVPEGTPVYASAGGTVSFSGTQRGYGETIIVEHGGGLATLYAHLKKRHVQQGRQVARGERLGDVGRTGNATTHHLHFEVRRDGVPVDPAGYLPLNTLMASRSVR